MNRRGQAEFVILVGLITFVIVFIILIYQAGLLGISPVPQEIAQQQKQVEESVQNLIRNGARETIRTMELQGGFLDPAPLSAEFAQRDVAYWQQCGNTMYPSLDEIRMQLNEGIAASLNENKEELMASYASLDVAIGDADVSASILNSKVDLTVTMPTSVRGYAIRQPYVVSVDTRLGELYEFGAAFSDAAAQERYLENFMIISLYQSPDLPTTGLLTSCGERIFRTQAELADILEGLVTYTIGNTIWWDLPEVASHEAAYFGIGALNGKRFVDLDPRFYLPDDFALRLSGPVSVTNNNRLATVFPILVFDCASTYNIGYDITYPVIVRAPDELLGTSLTFATLVSIDDNLPGSCGQATLSAHDACADRACSAHIAVAGRDGPLAGTRATFGACDIGVSDAQGIIDGPIACGEHEFFLEVNESYEFIHENITSDHLGNATYILAQKPAMTVHFNTVNVRKTVLPPLPETCDLGDPRSGSFAVEPQSGIAVPTYSFVFLSNAEGNYSLTNINETAFADDAGLGCEPSDQCLETGDGCAIDVSACTTGDIVDIVQADHIPPGTYVAEGYAIVPEAAGADGRTIADAGLLTGAFTATVTITEETSELVVTMPYLTQTTDGLNPAQTLGIADFEEDLACITAGFDAAGTAPIEVRGQ